jgi:4-amino-4-deoxy-L-arabinose transferase-like glycosyltransferase
MIVLLIQTVLFTRSAAIHGFATGDGSVKLWQVQGILRTGDLNAPLDYPGAVYDPDHQYAPFVEPWAFWKDGKFYTEYTSPFIWASVPLYALLGHAGLMILPWFCGMLLVIMTAWLAWRVRPDRSAALAPLVVGCASPLLVYSLEFWEHTPGAALAVFALIAVVKALDSRRCSWWLMASGAAIGLGLTMRAELYVYPIAIIIGLLFIRSTLPLIRSIGWLAIGGLTVAGPWWGYQFITWGSPFGPRLQQNVPVLGGTEMLARLGDTTGRNWAMVWPADGSAFLVVLTLALLIIALLVWALRRKQLRMADFGFWIGIVILVVMAILLIAQLAQGQRPDDLLTTFPLALMFLLPAPHGANPKSEINNQKSEILRFLTVVPLAFVVLVILVSPFHGGIQWGPRFLLPIIPPLTIVLIDRLAGLWGAINRSARVGLATALIALIAVGSYSTWQGVKFMQEAQTASEFMAEMIRQSPEKVVVSDAWFLPQGAPYIFGDKIWLMAEDEQKMFQLLQRLRKQTNEPGFIYTSALTWTHIDPQVLMGPRITPVEGSEKVYINAPTQYVEISRYQLLK